MKNDYQTKNHLVGHWNSFLFVLVSLLIIVQSQETLGDCKNMMLLPKQQGYYLRHHSVQNLTDVTKDVCQITCYMHESCMSYNYCTRSAICEINDSDKYRHPDDLVNKEDSVYIGTDNACKSSPCPSNATCTPNFYINSYICRCPAGFNGPLCTDIDECRLDSHNCSINQTCINTAGSFDCICKSGYERQGKTCIDIDECRLDSHNCSINQTCINTAGSFDCICKSGYERQEKTCIDIDECKTGAHNCSADSTCVNTEGSFECRCNDGYKMLDRKCTKIFGDYVITVYTAKEWFAGTDAKVFIILHGSHFKKEMSSSKVQLSGDFDQSSVDTSTINRQLPNMESLSKITMSHDGTGSYPAWSLDRVIVDNKTRRMKYTFQCTCWLGWSGSPLSNDIEPTKDSNGRPIVTTY